MKIFKQCAQWSSLLLILPLLTGCAAGSATAGYALKAKEADYLSAQGEQRITNRVKREIMLELSQGRPNFIYDQTSY